MSESQGLIYQQIAKVMTEIGAIAKDRKNESQGYRFRGIEDLYNAAHPVLAKHGVFCCPTVKQYEVRERESVDANGRKKLSTWIFMLVEHKFYAEDGSFVDVVTSGEGLDTSDKAANKCLSAAFKYALMELLCVPMADIEDSDRTSPEVTSKPATAKPVSFTRPEPAGAAAAPEVESKSRAKRVAAMKPETAPITDGKAAEIMKAGAESAVETVRAIAEAALGPEDPPDDKITVAQQQWLVRKFKESMPPQYQGAAVLEIMRKGWLKSEGFIGPDGEGSSKGIPASKFADISRKAIAWCMAQARPAEDKPPF